MFTPILCQDKYGIYEKLGGDPNRHLFGVFDGHGPHGTECAEYVRDNILEHLLAESSSSEPGAGIQALPKLNKAMHADPKVRDTLSGSTCVTAELVGKTLHFGNVGDSRATLARYSEDGRLIAEDMTDDQTPFRADERERVKRSGAQIFTFDQVYGKRPVDDEDFGTEEDNGDDPPRIWWNTEGKAITSPDDHHKCVAFTRSLGDLEVEAYLLHLISRLLSRFTWIFFSFY